jgi:hypothetical protein
MTALRFRGVVEGLAPIRESVSDRSRTGRLDFEHEIDTALECLGVDNYTFYLKGAVSGYRSALPFIATPPPSDSAWNETSSFGDLIGHIHARGATVGAILQIHRFDAASWGDEAIWATSRPDSSGELSEVVVAADHPLYQRRLRLLLHEVLLLYPELDYLFLEVESLNAAILTQPLTTWLGEKGLLTMAASELLYDDEILRTTKALGIAHDLAWSSEGLAFSVEITRRTLEIAKEVSDDARWKGQWGLVYSASGPESRSIPVAVPAKGWLLLPRISQPEEGSTRASSRRRAYGQHVAYLRREGRKVCCLAEGFGEQRSGVDASLEPAEIARTHLTGLVIAERAGSSVSPEERVRWLRRAGLAATS